MNYKNLSYLRVLFFCIIVDSCVMQTSQDVKYIICGDSYRIWHQLSYRHSQVYFYFDADGRKEMYEVYDDGRIEEWTLRDADFSGRWYVVNDSTIHFVHDMSIKIINDDKIILENQELNLLKDVNLINKIKEKIDEDTTRGENNNWKD